MKIFIKELSLSLCIGIAFFLFSSCETYFGDVQSPLITSTEYEDSIRFEELLNLSIASKNYQTQLQLAKEALAFAKKIKYVKGQAEAYIEIGNAHSFMGNLSESSEAIHQALHYYTLLSYEKGQAIAFNTLGSIYILDNNFNNALLYLKKALEINSKLKLQNAIAGDYNNIGEVYRLMHELDSALLNFQKANRIYLSDNDTLGKAYTQGNIGLVYAEKGDFQKAELFMNNASITLKKLKDYYPIAVYNIYMADIYINKNAYQEALKYALLGLKIGNEEGLKEQIRDASLKLSELYETSGEFKKAFFYQDQYLVYRDSINNEDVIRKMADLRTEFEVGQKQIEVDLLSQEAKTQRVILWGVVIVLVLVFVLTYVLFKLYRLRVRAIKISKRRRQVITAQRNELEDLNKTKDKFFSIISHDIRAPVNNFQGVSQLIKLYVESGETQELVRIAKIMDKSSLELSALLDNLLDWAMNQQGKFPYKPEQFSLTEICESNMSMMENLAFAKDINLDLSIDENISINADRNSVSTIIRNLLSNAIKFTPSGGKVKLSLESLGSDAIIEISDTGVGIPKDKMNNLFGFKGERSSWGTDGEKGVGLGLNLVHDFVLLNHGEIEVESEEDKGSMFTVTLPIELN